MAGAIFAQGENVRAFAASAEGAPVYSQGPKAAATNSRPNALKNLSTASVHCIAVPVLSRSLAACAKQREVWFLKNK